MTKEEQIKNKFKSSRELRDKISRNHQWHFYKDEDNEEEEEEREEDFDAYYDDIGSLYGDVFL